MPTKNSTYEWVRSLVYATLPNVQGGKVLITCDVRHDPFWEGIRSGLLERRNIVVVREYSTYRGIPIPTMENSDVVTNSRRPIDFDTVIIGLPLPPPYNVPSATTHNAFTSLRKAGIQLVLLEWPIWQVPPRLRESLLTLYRRALTVDYAKVRVRNRQIEERLVSVRRVRLTGSDGTDVTCEVDPNTVHTENCLFSEIETVMQLPGGEAWILPKQGSARGWLSVNCRGIPKLIRVEEGIAIFGETPPYPTYMELAEVGFGTNHAASILEPFNISEKVLGTCHLGFGDNRDLGGENKATYHFDIMIRKPTVVLE